jgi:hypothetical protein
MIRNKIMKMYVFIPLIMLLVACSDGGDATDGTDNSEHVWSSQVNTIDKAKGVEDILGESNDRQREDIDRQSQ